MHIAFITPEYPCTKFKGNYGGIGTFVHNLASQLVANNHSVTIFVYSQESTLSFVENGISIHFVSIKKAKGFTWFVNRKHFNTYVNKIIKEQNIEVLEAPEWTGFTAFMNFNCPLILRLHGSDTYFCELENRKVKWKNQFFERKALHNCEKIVGVSKFVSDKTQELFHIKNVIQVIYNTIDVTSFVPNHKHIIPKTLLYFGTIIRKKGVLEIAEVFNKLVKVDPEIKLTCIGRDSIDVSTSNSTLSMFKGLLTDAAQKNLNYLEALPYGQIKKQIQKAEIVLLPSFAEAFPMTWLEAMALEKKVVTSDIGWANELMIDMETGCTTNPINHDDFCNKVLFLLKNEEQAIAMSKNARIRIESVFNHRAILEQNVQLYKTTINEI